MLETVQDVMPRQWARRNDVTSRTTPCHILVPAVPRDMLCL